LYIQWLTIGYVAHFSQFFNVAKPNLQPDSTFNASFNHLLVLLLFIYFFIKCRLFQFFETLLAGQKCLEV